MVCITTNHNGNFFYNNLVKFLKNNNNITFISNSSVDDLIKIIYNSMIVISCHTGFLVHFAACFNKKIIDVVPKSIFNELDRWIPFDINYSRYEINELDKIEINSNIKI